MALTLKRNAVLVFGLAILFYWSFTFAKHDPGLRSVIPFGEDPYDAVGSFAVIVGMLIALLSLGRAFLPYNKKATSDSQRLYLVRSQQAVVLVVFITLATDMIAMARHPSSWIRSPSRAELIALIGGLAVAALGVQWFVTNSRTRSVETGSMAWRKALVAALFSSLVLALYPEQLIGNTIGHLFTVIVGDLVLFAPMRLLLIWLVPYEEHIGTVPKASKHVSVSLRWGIVALFGILLGAFLFIAEMREGGSSLPLLRLLFVASVLIGLALAGLLLAYAFLGTPLGLRPSQS